MEKVIDNNQNNYAALVRKALLDYEDMKDKEERLKEVLMDVLELNLNRSQVMMNQTD